MADKKPPSEDYTKPKGDLLPAEINAICRLCRVANNKRMTTQKVECERTERTGMYCRLIENLRVAFQSQAREIEFCRRYVDLFKGSRACFRKDELKAFYDENGAKENRSFEEFIDFCRISGLEVIE
ncbi:MAG: hypothetical protein IJ309_02405 [Clostridia bacterium]|nr:hypothetical protein [Clostridia bacterium]